MNLNTVVVLSVCLSVCMYVCPNTLFYNERCHRVKRQIYGNIKKAFLFYLSYSKVRAFFTHSAGAAIFS